MRKFFKKRWYIFAVLLLLIFFYFWRDNNQKAKIKSEKSYKVKNQNLREELSLSGEIDSEEKVILRFQTSGKLSWVGVKEGDYVQKYQGIASLDQREVQQNLKKYLNTYLDKRLDFDQEKDDTEIKDVGNLSEDARRAAIRVLDQAQYDLNNAVIDVELKKLAIEYSYLYSPIEGIVVKAGSAYAGVNITPAQAEFEIVNPGTLYFAATADQTDVVKLHEGITGKMILDAFPEKTYSGNLYYISFIPKEDETGTVYSLKFALDEQSLALPLKMKMTGDLDILIKERKNVLSVPTAYIKDDKKGTYVNIVENNKKIKRYVEVDEEIDGNSIVIKGLSQGDVIYD